MQLSTLKWTPDIITPRVFSDPFVKQQGTLGVSETRPKLKEIPTNVGGVYFFGDEAGKVIYVGKSSSLRTRLHSYFRATRYTEKQWRIRVKTRFIRWEGINSEFQRQLREAELIYTLRPSFNRQLNPSFQKSLYIELQEAPLPHFRLVRSHPGPGAKSYLKIIPYPGITSAIKALNDLYRLPDCPKPKPKKKSLLQLPIWAEFKPSACIRYYTKACTAPCLGETENFQNSIDEAKGFFTEKQKQMFQLIENQINQLAAELKFERAGVLWKRLQLLTELSHQLKNEQEKERQLSGAISDDGTWYLLEKGYLREFSIGGQRHQVPAGGAPWSRAPIERCLANKLMQSSGVTVPFPVQDVHHTRLDNRSRRVE